MTLRDLFPYYSFTLWKPGCIHSLRWTEYISRCFQIRVFCVENRQISPLMAQREGEQRFASCSDKFRPLLSEADCVPGEGTPLTCFYDNFIFSNAGDFIKPPHPSPWPPRPPAHFDGYVNNERHFYYYCFYSFFYFNPTSVPSNHFISFSNVFFVPFTVSRDFDWEIGDLTNTQRFTGI